MQNTVTDVIIVGAGAAGIGATLRLRANGCSVILLEAGSRIGGRAFTDTTTFSVPIDRGCAWLHHANVNPWTALAREQSYNVLPHDDTPSRLYLNGQYLPEEANQHLQAAVTALDARIHSYTGQDMVLATFDTGTSWPERYARELLGPQDSGTDASTLSLHDLQHIRGTTPNFLIRQGFGSLVAHYGATLPIHCQQRVTSIDTSGSRIRVTSSHATVEAAACIVTVSTGILRAETIRFSPPLPEWKRDAIANLPMGAYAKLIFELNVRLPDVADDTWVSDVSRAKGSMPLLCHPMGTPLVIGFVGGNHGRELEHLGEAIALDIGRQELSKLFGTQIPQHIIKSAFASWCNEPDFLGAYSTLLPGAGDARAALARPIDDRLYFAGEAAAELFPQSCGGAFLSGQACADQILATMGASR